MFAFKIKAWTFISITYKKNISNFKELITLRSPLVKDSDSRSSFSPPPSDFQSRWAAYEIFTTLRQSVVHGKIIAMNNKTCTFAEICRERWMLFLPYYFRFGRLYLFTVAWMACKWKHQPKKKDAKRLYQHWSPCTSAVQVLDNQNCFDIGGWWVSPCWIGCDLSLIYSFSLCILTKETPDFLMFFQFLVYVFSDMFFDFNKEKRLTFNN